jgi:uncharacterized membrane protein (DUF106 family)
MYFDSVNSTLKNYNLMKSEIIIIIVIICVFGFMGVRMGEGANDVKPKFTFYVLLKVAFYALINKI